MALIPAGSATDNLSAVFKDTIIANGTARDAERPVGMTSFIL